uniref:Uncharacterized protein n=1 Tax=Caenorhabditis japonica TaxID=281687 RepID=A0A8R1E6U6_CAEJA
MKDFSHNFSNWWSKLSKDDRENFGTFVKLDKPSSSYWKRANVVLSLPEFELEGTQFRRARHICRLSGPQEEDLYLQIDSGILIAVKSGKNTVRRLPQKWAREPPAVVQVYFPRAKDKMDVSKHIEQIRRTSVAYVGSIKTCDRQKAQEAHFQPPKNSTTVPWRQWKDTQTAMLLPIREYQKPSLATFFCGERYCMGLCCTDFLRRKSSICDSGMFPYE